MEYTVITDTTNAENQDKAAVFNIHGRLAFALSDGAGGVGGGAEAAQAVIDGLRYLDCNDYVAAFKKIDNAIAANSSFGEATAVYITLQDNLLAGVSVGDSEAWLIKKEDVMFLTKNQIHKPLLGTGSSVPVKFGGIVFSGTLLLASDGLTKYASTEKIISIIRTSANLKNCARELIELVRYPSGNLPDDTTIVLCASERRRAD